LTFELQGELMVEDRTRGQYVLFFHCETLWLLSSTTILN